MLKLKAIYLILLLNFSNYLNAAEDTSAQMSETPDEMKNIIRNVLLKKGKGKGKGRADLNSLNLLVFHLRNLKSDEVEDEDDDEAFLDQIEVNLLQELYYLANFHPSVSAQEVSSSPGESLDESEDEEIIRLAALQRVVNRIEKEMKPILEAIQKRQYDQMERLIQLREVRDHPLFGKCNKNIDLTNLCESLTPTDPTNSGALSFNPSSSPETLALADLVSLGGKSEESAPLSTNGSDRTEAAGSSSLPIAVSSKTSQADADGLDTDADDLDKKLKLIGQFGLFECISRRDCFSDLPAKAFKSDIDQSLGRQQLLAIFNAQDGPGAIDALFKQAQAVQVEQAQLQHFTDVEKKIRVQAAQAADRCVRANKACQEAEEAHGKIVQAAKAKSQALAHAKAKSEQAAQVHAQAVQAHAHNATQPMSGDQQQVKFNELGDRVSLTAKPLLDGQTDEVVFLGTKLPSDASCDNGSGAQKIRADCKVAFFAVQAQTAYVAQEKAAREAQEAYAVHAAQEKTVQAAQEEKKQAQAVLQQAQAVLQQVLARKQQVAHAQAQRQAAHEQQQAQTQEIQAGVKEVLAILAPMKPFDSLDLATKKELQALLENVLQILIKEHITSPSISTMDLNVSKLKNEINSRSVLFDLVKALHSSKMPFDQLLSMKFKSIDNKYAPELVAFTKAFYDRNDDQKKHTIKRLLFSKHNDVRNGNNSPHTIIYIFPVDYLSESQKREINAVFYSCTPSAMSLEGKLNRFYFFARMNPSFTGNPSYPFSESKAYYRIIIDHELDEDATGDLEQDLCAVFKKNPLIAIKHFIWHELPPALKHTLRPLLNDLRTTTESGSNKKVQKCKNIPVCIMLKGENKNGGSVSSRRDLRARYFPDIESSKSNRINVLLTNICDLLKGDKSYDDGVEQAKAMIPEQQQWLEEVRVMSEKSPIDAFSDLQAQADQAKPEELIMMIGNKKKEIAGNKLWNHFVSLNQIKTTLQQMAFSNAHSLQRITIQGLLQSLLVEQDLIGKLHKLNFSKRVELAYLAFKLAERTKQEMPSALLAYPDAEKAEALATKIEKWMNIYRWSSLFEGLDSDKGQSELKRIYGENDVVLTFPAAAKKIAGEVRLAANQCKDKVAHIEASQLRAEKEGYYYVLGRKELECPVMILERFGQSVATIFCDTKEEMDAAKAAMEAGYKTDGTVDAMSCSEEECTINFYPGSLKPRPHIKLYLTARDCPVLVKKEAGVSETSGSAGVVAEAGGGASSSKQSIYREVKLEKQEVTLSKNKRKAGDDSPPEKSDPRDGGDRQRQKTTLASFDGASSSKKRPADDDDANERPSNRARTGEESGDDDEVFCMPEALQNDIEHSEFTAAQLVEKHPNAGFSEADIENLIQEKRMIAVADSDEE